MTTDSFDYDRLKDLRARMVIPDNASLEDVRWAFTNVNDAISHIGDWLTKHDDQRLAQYLGALHQHRAKVGRMIEHWDNWAEYERLESLAEVREILGDAWDSAP